MPETRVHAVHAFARARLYSPAGFIAYMPDLTPGGLRAPLYRWHPTGYLDEELEQARIRLLCT